MFPGIVSGNLTLSISDHLPQFLIVPNIFLTHQAENLTNERDWPKFDQENFTLDYFSIDWDQKSGIEETLISPLKFS